MKEKSIFLCSFLAINMSMQAQSSQLEYYPFAQEGKTWEAQVGGIKENVYGNRIDGDTLINGERWMKVYNYIGSPEFNYSYYAAIRDVGNKVYSINKGSTRPRLLYDFGLKVGNTIRCGVENNAFACLIDVDEDLDTLFGFQCNFYLRVQSIDTIVVYGMKLRHFTLALLDSFRERIKMTNNIVWVEGVGSDAGPFMSWMPFPSQVPLIRTCKFNRTCIFQQSDFYRYNNAIKSPLQETKMSKSVYDLHGRRLNVAPEHGLYIQDGKKTVCK